MKRIATLAAAVVVAAPATAAAETSSTCQAYNPQICQIVHQPNGTSGTGSGTLPFTGLDVALLLVGGGGLVGGGLVMRRLSTRID